MNNAIDVMVVCIDCGEQHSEPQDDDRPWTDGDYGEFWCEMCGCETEHKVVAVEERS